MEDTDGGLHPAVDGQSLDEDEYNIKVLKTYQMYSASMHSTSTYKPPIYMQT